MSTQFAPVKVGFAFTFSRPSSMEFNWTHPIQEEYELETHLEALKEEAETWLEANWPGHHILYPPEFQQVMENKGGIAKLMRDQGAMIFL